MRSRTLILGALLVAGSIAMLACERTNPTAPQLPAAEPGAVSATVGSSTSSVRGGQPKVDICHYDNETGEYIKISVAEPAVPAHLAHGDGFPGSAELDLDCNPVSGSIRVEAFIDGISQLTLRGETAQWHHYDFAAPGLLNGQNEPTIINGVLWYPVWPDTGDPERRFCDCDSDVFTGVVPPVPPQEFLVSLNEIAVREKATVIEHPSAANGFAVVIEFDDNGPGGADWYVVEFDVPAAP